MHTHKFLRSLSRCLLSAALVAGVATTASVFAVDGPTPGLFELDGNTADAGPNPGDDWDGLFLGTQAGTPAAFTGILEDPAPVTIYWQGGSKDIEDVTQWHYKNGSVPDKDDITNAYATAYTVPALPAGYGGPHEEGDLIIYFGLDRFANSGDAFAGFWFFQDDVGLDGNDAFTGQHTARVGTPGQPGYLPGDLLVLVEYPQGSNAQPEIKVYEWDPADVGGDNVANNLDEIYSSTEAKCDGSGDKLACAITNVANLPGAPEWDYVNKTGYNGIPFESFFEGGINVSKLLGGEVPCFSSFLAETRSSRSETAQLKDFVLGDFNLCSIAVTKSCTAAINDAGDGIDVDFNGVVTNNGGLALSNVTVTDDNGTPGNTGDDIVVFGPATLAPGESQPYDGSYPTTAIPATDTVIAEGHRNGTTVSATADATCSPDISPDLAITKQCTAAVNGAGTGVDVLFNGLVSNTGNVALEDVTVVDDQGTADVNDDVTVLGPISLAPGASQAYNGSYSASSGDTFTDHVTATGSDVLTQTPVQANAEATCEADINPAILVSKICTADINAGGTGIDVLFSGTVSNTGNVALGNVTVVDDHGTANPADDVTVLGPITLAPGASANYSGGFGASGASSTDQVTASGTDVLTSTAVSDTETASCSADINPAILVTKACAADINSGGTGIDVLFNGTVSNTGNVALGNVTVVDDRGTADPGDDVTVLGPISLAPGASAPYSGGFSASGSSSTDTVTAAGTDVVTSTPVSDTATASCAADVTPDILVTKQCTDAPAFGQPIQYNGSVTNTGNVALLGVVVVDDNGTPGNLADDVTFNLGDLAPGASTVYNGSYTPAVEGTYTNTVVANASDAVESTPVSSTANATCEVPPPQEFEGCTPGFWKNSVGSWAATPYSPNQRVDSVFTLPSGVLNNQLGDDTLLQALGYPGGTNLLGAAQILLRAAVASVLNATHPEVDDFPYTAAQVISQVNAALATKDRATILALASTLDAANNLGCDLPNDNSF